MPRWPFFLAKEDLRSVLAIHLVNLFKFEASESLIWKRLFTYLICIGGKNCRSSTTFKLRLEVTHLRTAAKMKCRLLHLVRSSSTHLLHVLAIFCCAFAAYYPALDAGLVFDDQAAIVKNADLRPESSLLDLFANDYWGTKLNSVSVQIGLLQFVLVGSSLVSLGFSFKLLICNRSIGAVRDHFKCFEFRDPSKEFEKPSESH